MTAASNTFVTILEFILIFGVLVFIHEFGHYIVARLNHIEVEEFGFGYPPRLFKLFRFSGTDFTLNAIPIGGFCRMKGETGNTQEPGSFTAAAPGRRFLTLLGGPVMNLLLGMILIAILIVRIGVADPTRVLIYGVDANSPAAAASIQAGDIIEKINGTPVTSLDNLSSLIEANLGKSTNLTILRGSTTLNVTLVPRVNPPKGHGAMGVGVTNPTIPVSFFQAIPAAFSETINQGVQLIMVPVKLISGQIAPSSARVVSVKGLYDIFSQVKTEDVKDAATMPSEAGMNTLYYVAILSIALGYTNLLPIPALDGGHILFVLPELLFHKKVPLEFENRVHLIGYSLLMILMVVLIINDIINPVVIH